MDKKLVLEHSCNDSDLQPIDHPDNSEDWNQSYSTQGYRVYQCKVCGDYWGIRHQWDMGTGHDDRSHRFGSDISEVKRHYQKGDGYNESYRNAKN